MAVPFSHSVFKIRHFASLVSDVLHDKLGGSTFLSHSVFKIRHFASLVSDVLHDKLGGSTFLSHSVFKIRHFASLVSDVLHDKLGGSTFLSHPVFKIRHFASLVCDKLNGSTSLSRSRRRAAWGGPLPSWWPGWSGGLGHTAGGSRSAAPCHSPHLDGTQQHVKQPCFI